MLLRLLSRNLRKSPCLVGSVRIENTNCHWRDFCSSDMLWLSHFGHGADDELSPLCLLGNE
jgi:hypothetical protein